MSQLGHRLHATVRPLLRERTFAFAVIGTLALVIGANAAIFSAVYAVLLKPLPFDQPERLVALLNSYPGAGADRGGASAPDYVQRREEIDAFEDVALYQSPNRSLALGSPETGPSVRQVSTFAVTPSFFRLLRVRPARGTLFAEEDGAEGANDKVILSHGLWQSLGGEEALLGQDLRIDGRPHTVVGILERGFRFIDPEIELWTPIALSDEQKDRPHSNQWQMVARLRGNADGGPGLAAAQAQIDALNHRNLDRYPEFREALINAGFETRVVPLHQDLVREVRPSLFLLWGGGLFVLLIGAVNLTNLVLVRALGRRRETATRVALGAGRRELLGLALKESLALVGAGTALGLFLGHLGLLALRRFGLDRLPRGSEVAVDSTVALVIVGVALLVALVLALLPVLKSAARTLSTTLREGGRSGTGSRSNQRVRRGLVVLQVAVAFVLLAASALLLVSFRQILAIDPGFSTEGRLTARVYPPPSRYETQTDLGRFAEAALERLRGLPGVASAAATSTLPFGTNFNDSVILAEGYQPEPGESLISPLAIDVSAGYFETMEVPLLAGRTFDSRDVNESPSVIVVSERLAKKFWPGASPLGRRMFFPDNPEDLMKPGPDTEFYSVVGVVGDVHLRSLVQQSESVGAYYFPMTQTASRSMSFVLETDLDAAALGSTVERTLQTLDPEVPVFSVRTLEERMAESLTTRRATLLLALTFAAVALLLAALGLYGVLAFQVRQRRREIGIRMAVGSDRSRILSLILKEGLALVLFGAVLGLAGAFLTSKTLAGQLYGVGPLDPVVLTLATAILGTVALLACYLPARRATRVDPAIVLTQE